MGGGELAQGGHGGARDKHLEIIMGAVSRCKPELRKCTCPEEEGGWVSLLQTLQSR